MPLSWNEIKSRALAFSKEWADETSEDAEAKTFWDGFFDVFGITRRRVASFEAPVKKSDGKGGFIDLLWRGVLLVEHKSRGKDLDRAAHQAFDYFPGLKERDLPRFVLVSDFARFRLYDLDEQKEYSFGLADLHKNVRLFGFISGYQSRSFAKEDAVNVRAAERLGKLHDLLKASGYEGHQLEILLVRMLFCLFGEDTGIFERRQFADWIEQRTAIDGSDLGPMLGNLFEVLDTPIERRQKKLDEQLAAFPYVNGKLFAETLRSASFDRAMRETLLDCAALDWSQISPAIFGSLFQSIMDSKERRNLGAHYTTEANIRKALGPLFLEDLISEFEKIRGDKKSTSKRLFAFHEKLANIRILDPACGCGNFLVIAYQELRALELEVLREIFKDKQDAFLDVGSIVFVDVDQFYGIEIEEFPAQIAQVALWLTDHQMNLRVSEEFGQYFVRLPLKKAPNIANNNALTLDWTSLIEPSKLSYIVGNPPFRGKQYQTPDQKREMGNIFSDVKGAGVLDFVACWHRKATDFMVKNPSIRTAFVSTNSITQGEQVGILWGDLFRRGVIIHFAHRTFQWTSEARGKAAVHCVIIGFALHDKAGKVIFEYDSPQSDPHELAASNINPYLVDADNLILTKRRTHIGGARPMAFGSMPNDGGFLLMDTEDKAALLAAEPNAKPWIRRTMGTDEFIYDIKRWCLWLVGIKPSELRALPNVLSRVEKVREKRLESTRPTTQALAGVPTLFGEIRQPKGRYLAIPEVSSERRIYLPIDFLSESVIATNKLYTMEGAKLYEFGVMASIMHMAWMRAVCGRLESRYQYSSGIVYNNFPWPQATKSQVKAIEVAAKAVLDARALYKGSTLADLYDPLAMPPELIRAHKFLDKTVDAAYGKKAFGTEAERVAYLFNCYQSLVAPLVAAKSPRRRKTVH